MQISNFKSKKPLLFFFAIFATTVAAGAQCPELSPIVALRFEGLKATQPHVVSRELKHAPGKLFRDSVWQTEKRRLESLDLFADMGISCAGDTLVYRFRELFQYFPAPAGKKTDQDGWMLGLALAHLNVAGEDIRVEGQFRTTVDPWWSAKEYAFYASSPWWGDWPLDWNIELLRTDSWDALRNFHEKSWALWTDWRYALGGHWAGLATAGGRYFDRDDGVNVLGSGLLFDSRDARLDARHGIYAEARATQYGGALGGDENFTEYLLDGRVYYGQGPHIYVFSGLARWRPGTQKFYERLHQGGANSLRGFDPDSSTHGRHEMLFNAEYRYAAIERHPVEIAGIAGFWGLQLVGGADGAFLWNDTWPDREHYRSAVYGGVHLLIPALDRLRCEVGFSPENGEPVIAVGLFEKNTTQRWRSR